MKASHIQDVLHIEGFTPEDIIELARPYPELLTLPAFKADCRPDKKGRAEDLFFFEGSWCVTREELSRTFGASYASTEATTRPCLQRGLRNIFKTLSRKLWQEAEAHVDSEHTVGSPIRDTEGNLLSSTVYVLNTAVGGGGGVEDRPEISIWLANSLLLFGNKGNIAIEEPSNVVIQNADGTGAKAGISQYAYCLAAPAFLGTEAVAVGFSDPKEGVTDRFLADILSTFAIGSIISNEPSIGSEAQTFFFMNRSSLSSLRASREALFGTGGPEGPESRGYSCESWGCPIIVTASIE